ncbi:MAG TPA: heat-shock protein Hsp70, partial [Gammaproteobacteria bacterium]|nr:heat-shock protein Hsp70 [Gammaproteobacteria bacterium]
DDQRNLTEEWIDNYNNAEFVSVITVPAYFSDAQRQATRDAGKIAGLEVERIINEPTAASLAYKTDQDKARTILVYDLGGGTFDVSVVKMASDVVEVLASHGDNQLGGDDFDEKIIAHLMDALKQKYGDSVELPARALSRINRAAETAKIALSSQPYYRIEEEHLFDHEGQPAHLSLELSREDYETMIAPYFEQTLSAIHTALDGARLRVADLDEILLVGGSTRTPLIARRLKEELGLAPRADVDPDLCVAMGAALQAAMIAGEQVSSVLVDVTPYTFGVSAISERNGEWLMDAFVPIIRKYTPIPATQSESFYTAYDGQEEIKVTVYQGENPNALDNTEIGEFIIKGLADVPQGNPIITTFSLDINGILHVTTREKNTGLEKSLTIDNAISRFQEEELDKAREEVEGLMGEDQAGSAAQQDSVSTAALNLIEKATSLLETASAEDQEDIREMTDAVRQALADGDPDNIRQAVSELSDLVYYLDT